MNKLIITGGSGFIGTNLIEVLESENYKFFNLDKAQPTKESHRKYWIKINLLNFEDIKKIINDIRPTTIIHLAARTDTYSNKIEDYIDNTKGTENLVEAIKDCDSVNYIIITSTQYVYKSNTNPFPSYDTSYLPFTVYGESKRITEEIIRNSKVNCAWTIIRPTNVWGPWHLRYPKELWRLIDLGYYFHPGRSEVIRTYGYVKNVVHQIISIISAPLSEVDKKTFYLGDLPIDSIEWLNEISVQLTNRKIKIVPRYLFKPIAQLGDILRLTGINFPLYIERYKNMIEDYYAPTNITIEKFGLYNSSLQENVNETINWLKDEQNKLFSYWNKKFKKNK